MKFKPLYNPTKLTCQITIGDFPACEGIQKLIGFGRGLGFHRVPYFPYWHHSNSIRLGYNRSENKDFVRLHLYAYVNGKNEQRNMGDFFVGEKLNIMMVWSEIACAIDINNKSNKLISTHAVLTGFKTLPIGFFLYPYAELDGPENKQIPFEVDIKDLKVNGKMIKIK